MHTFTPQRERGWVVWLLIAISIVLHVIFFYTLDALDLEKDEPTRETRDKYITVDVQKKKPAKKKEEEPPPPEPEPEPEPQVAELTPEPLPEPPPEPPPEPKKKKKPEKAKKKPDTKPAKKPGSAAPRPNEIPKEPVKEPVKPKFGISMKATSSSGSGPAMTTGNTATGNPDSAGGPGGPLGDGDGVGRGTGSGDGDSQGSGSGPGDGEGDGDPVPVYTVNKMPKMAGKCRGKYTPEARKAGIEGSVSLDLVVGADGKTRDIKVVDGLGYGLDTSAIRALKKCRFSPAERGGKPVSVRIEGFKISFYLAR